MQPNKKCHARETEPLSFAARVIGNDVMYDDQGMPNVMVAIPRFMLSDVIDGGPDVPHPAFVVGGEVRDVIYISKYLASLHGGRAASLPMQEPKNLVTYGQAKALCRRKGAGWHLMTNAEWAAIALWCKKNGTLPHGNSCHGADEFCRWEYGVPIEGFNEQGKLSVKTGASPLSWAHNGQASGIWDLHGNLYEWLSGARLVDGEIQIIADNDAALMGVRDDPDSDAWRAILPDGALVAPGTEGTLRYDCSVEMPDKGEIPFHINTALEHPAPGSESNNSAYGKMAFEGLKAKAGVQIPPILKALCLAPVDDAPLGQDVVYMRSTGERMMRRGGYWGTGENAGIFCINFNYERSFLFHGDGFRAAYIEP